MNSASPFGAYAGLVAALCAVAIIGAWIASSTGIAGMQTSPQLDTIALVVVGAIFGTGAGALVVANGLGRQLTVTGTRLDAIDAPSGPMATAIVEHRAADIAAHAPPPGGDG